MKRPLLDDLEWFLKDETRTFYAKHGIPYHRCYLLHGEPGTGKTSFMNSVAGHIQRNLCFIQMDKHMTDDTFRISACRFTHRISIEYCRDYLSFPKNLGTK